MRTVVELRQDVPQSQLKKGDIGYIDGYVRAADNRPYAVVVSGTIIDLCPFWNIKVVK